MGLPAPNSTWPPLSMEGPYSKMQEWAAWYSGEPNRIMDVYAAQQSSQSTVAVPWWRFWSRARSGAEGAQRALLHVPVASDLASVSASLLFGEEPKIRVHPVREMDALIADQQAEVEAENEQAIAEHESEKAAIESESESVPPASPGPGLPPPNVPSKPKLKAMPTVKPQSAEERAESRYAEIAEKGNFFARLLEAAETAAAMGGVYIYPVWDQDLIDVPLLGVAQADQAVPEFRWGLLTAVTFHRIIGIEGNKVTRHVERHEVEGTGESRKAVVLNAVYVGTYTNLGETFPLRSFDATRTLEPRVELPFKELDVQYLPNRRPNPLWRASALGVPDIQGSETLLDALDETYASWIRDVRLAKARIIVPNEYLRPDAEGNPAFDLDQEIYVGMDMEPVVSQDARSMMAHQFGIRHLEHAATADNLISRIVSNAGYTPSTLGHTSTAAGDSASALRVTEHKTLLTLRRKSAFWGTAIANVLFHMAQIDAEVFKSGVEPLRPTVVPSDSIIDSKLELAQTVMAMKTAEAASIETRIRILHPEWSTDEVKAEVERIKGELEAAKPAPAAVTPQFGKPSAPEAAGDAQPMTQDGPPRGNTTPPPQVGAKPPV